MARPIEFDRDDVITRATDQFWKDGYVASSVQKLLDATGINRGTMYNSFGEKDVFFRSCVDHYNAKLAGLIDETLGNKAMKAADALRGFFQQTVNAPGPSRRNFGCLLVNSLCESIAWDEDLGRLVRESLNGLRKSFLARTRELEKSKGLAGRQSAEFAADQLLLVYETSKLAARAGKPPKQLLDHIEFSLAAILK